MTIRINADRDKLRGIIKERSPQQLIRVMENMYKNAKVFTDIGWKKKLQLIRGRMHGYSLSHILRSVLV
jgi:hypothetical protein